MEAILNFDWSVFQFVENYLWCPFLDAVMTFITHLGDGGVIWIITAVILIFTKKYRKCGIAMGVGLLGSLVFVDWIIKPVIARPRPFNFEGWPAAFNFPGLISEPSSWSFPSGHSSSSFAAATALFATNKKLGIPALILAFLVAFSRIYVHVHYPTDVIAGILFGAFLGAMAALIVTKAYPKAENKLKNRKAEK